MPWRTKIKRVNQFRILRKLLRYFSFPSVKGYFLICKPFFLRMEWTMFIEHVFGSNSSLDRGYCQSNFFFLKRGHNWVLLIVTIHYGLDIGKDYFFTESCQDCLAIPLLHRSTKIGRQGLHWPFGYHIHWQCEVWFVYNSHNRIPVE